MSDDHDERPGEEFGNWVAKRTFIWTVILAVLTIGSVFAFILRY